MAQSYPLPLSTLQLTVAGQDRTTVLIARTLQVQGVLQGQANTCNFTLQQPGPPRPATISVKPIVGQAVLAAVQTGSGAFVNLFGGTISRVNEVKVATGVVNWMAQCVDYTSLLSRRMVRGIFSGAVTDIVNAVVSQFAPQIRLDPSLVETNNRVIAGIAFNYSYPKDCLDQLATLTGWQWFIDPLKFLHFYDPSLAVHASPNQVTDTSQNFVDLAIEPQLDQVRNRIWVRGGNSLSDFIAETFVADGGTRSWTLRNANITQIAMTIDGVNQTIAQQGGTNAEDDFQFLYSQNTDGTTTVSATGATVTPVDLAELVFTYKFQYPINVMVEDVASQQAVALLANNYAADVLDIDDAAPATPVGYWKLSETGSATIAVDSSGSGHNGTYENNVNAPRAIGSAGGQPGAILGMPSNTAVMFDGANLLVSVPDAVSLQLGTAGATFTIAFWVRHDPADRNAARAMISRCDLSAIPFYEIRVNYLQIGAVSFHSDYATITGALDTGESPTNTTAIPLPDAGYHFIAYAYDGASFSGYLDGQLQWTTPCTLAIGPYVSVPLILGARNNTQYLFLGTLDEIALWNGTALTANQVLRLYQDATEDGIRETLITQNDLTLLSEARAVAELELAQWADIITNITFSSYVSGWAVGDTVTISVTHANTGRDFSGTALIQSLNIAAQGAELLRYDIQCSAARFNLIDFWMQMTQQRTAIAGVVGSDIPYISTVDDSNQAILVDGGAVSTSLTPPFYVAPDWGSGTTPYIVADFWVVDPNAF